MSGRKVFVAGWRGPVPRWGSDWTVLALWRVLDAARPCPGGSALVMGSIGLESLTPHFLEPHFFTPYAVAVGVVQHPCRADLAAWKRLAFLTLALESDAEHAVQDVRELSCRMPVPPGAFLPAGAESDPRIRRIVEVLLHTTGLTVGEVARLLGLERHRPTQDLKRATGWTVLDVRLAHVLHYYNSERARGIPANRIRIGLDFANTSNLLRSVAAARRRFGRS